MNKNLDFTKITDEAFDSFIKNSFPYYITVVDSRICVFENKFDFLPIYTFSDYVSFNKFLCHPEDW